MPENNNPFEEFSTSQNPLKAPKTDPVMVLAKNYSELAFAMHEMLTELHTILSDDEASKEAFIEKWNEHLAWIDALCNIHTQNVIEMF